MGLRSDRVQLLSLTAATTSGNGPWVDLRDYMFGALWIVTTAFAGTSWTPGVPLTSPDQGAHSVAMPATEGPGAGGVWTGWNTAIVATGTLRFPLPTSVAATDTYGALNLGWLQVPYTVTAATITANVYFIGHV
jgi:hypothetical protein